MENEKEAGREKRKPGRDSELVLGRSMVTDSLISTWCGVFFWITLKHACEVEDCWCNAVTVSQLPRILIRRFFREDGYLACTGVV